MIGNSPSIIIPLRVDERGAIFIGNSRVTLDTVIARYHQGDGPEAIHSGFPTISVMDIYAVIAYYLVNRDEVDAYLKRRDETADQIRREVEANYTSEQQARTDDFKALLAQKRQDQNH